jgi:hypothetical protein
LNDHFYYGPIATSLLQSGTLNSNIFAMHLKNQNASGIRSAWIHRLGLLGLLAGCSGLLIAAEKTKEVADSSFKDGFVWPSTIPADCPFPRSPTLTGIYFTGRHSDYQCGDTFYPSWASDFSPGWNGVDLKFNPPGGQADRSFAASPIGIQHGRIIKFQDSRNRASVTEAKRSFSQHSLRQG